MRANTAPSIELRQKVFGAIFLGCDKNRVDGERLLGEIKARGCKITDDPSRAQILIVNSCAFLNEARKEAIETVLEENRRREGGLEKIVLSGCLPEKYIEELFPELVEADVFLGISDSSALFPALERAYRGERVNAVKTGTDSKTRLVSTPYHYKYLKIAEGCSNGCTYCLIPKIRGKYRSAPFQELIKEAKSLEETKELILVAQDITRYGEDRGQNELVPLIRELSALENISSLRLLYCYPEKISGELIDEIAQNPKIIKYLDIPLQHSEDRILKRMGRKGTREEYLSLIRTLRERIPKIALRSTFITGFPSETKEEHLALISFLKEAQFENCGFFAYSKEPETPAYSFPDQISAKEKKLRRKELYAAQREISSSKLERFRGKSLRVLCDGIDLRRGCFVGRAYFQAPEIDGTTYFTAKRAKEGEWVEVEIEQTKDYDLYGREKGEADESSE